jgi:hypothetical protein
VGPRPLEAMSHEKGNVMELNRTGINYSGHGDNSLVTLTPLFPIATSECIETKLGDKEPCCLLG